MTDKPAILFIGHGSRDPDAVEEFKQLSSHFRNLYPERLCETGFLEFATPVIATGVDKLVSMGAKKITAIPGMLMAAGHAKNDIPSELNQLQRDIPDVEITYAAELGVTAPMLQAAQDRIEEAEKQFSESTKDYDRSQTLLVVVGRGASDPDANSNISKIARMLEEGMGFGWVVTCYSGVTSPLVPDALEKSHKLGFKRVIIFPYFLFTGILVKKIYDWADQYHSKYPDVQVAKAGYLNDHHKVLEMFSERLQEAEQGNPNMNCQLCQYRVQIVGNEHKVGQPQEGHHHHVRGIGVDDHGHHHHHHDHSHSHK